MKFGYVLVRVPKDDPVSCEVMGAYSEGVTSLGMAAIANSMFNNHEAALAVTYEEELEIYETDKSYYQIHSTHWQDESDIY